MTSRLLQMQMEVQTPKRQWARRQVARRPVRRPARQRAHSRGVSARSTRDPKRHALRRAGSARPRRRPHSLLQPRCWPARQRLTALRLVTERGPRRNRQSRRQLRSSSWRTLTWPWKLAPSARRCVNFRWAWSGWSGAWLATWSSTNPSCRGRAGQSWRMPGRMAARSSASRTFPPRDRSCGRQDSKPPAARSQRAGSRWPRAHWMAPRREPARGST